MSLRRLVLCEFSRICHSTVCRQRLGKFSKGSFNKDKDLLQTSTHALPTNNNLRSYPGWCYKGEIAIRQ